MVVVEIQLDFDRRYRLVREIISTVVLVVILSVIIHVSVQDFSIEGTSMEPSLHNRELILVDKWAYLFRTPRRGDIIVFVAPPDPSEMYVKRIIGLPGDVITIFHSSVIVNGQQLNESYIDPHRQGNPYPDIVNLHVPPESYFVLGDNRTGSSDSRDWGCVPQQNIIGRATLIYWPILQDNSGLLPDVAAVYQHISPPRIDPATPTISCRIASQLPN